LCCRFRALFDQAFQLVQLLDPAGIILEVNQSVLGLTQAAPTDIVGHPIWELPIHRLPETAGCLRRAVVEAAEGKLIRCEVDLLGPRDTPITIDLSLKPVQDERGRLTLIIAEGRDITERKRAEQERELLIRDLRDALAKVKLLSGLLPICAACKKIRDDEGAWSQLETYVQRRSEATFSHGLCPDCTQKLYPDLFAEIG
jgi:PAS domain S-box-containing protein